MRVAGFLFVLLTMTTTLPAASRAADARYPDWPCVQLKVPQLSAAAMWDGPSIADVGNTWQDDPKVRDLVARLAARRTSLDEAKKLIAAFITGSPSEKKDKAKKLFAGLFDTLSAQRGEVMSGIERVTRNEKGLAAKIAADVARLHALEDDPKQDLKKVTTLANEVAWSTRIFEDRRKTIRYVCDVPTVIEQRVFALARAIRQTLD